MRANTAGVHHVTIRVNDLEASRRFYEDVLGFETAAPEEGLFLFQAGNTVLIFRPPLEGTPAGDRFSEYRVGFDHLAFAVEDRGELERLVQRLRTAGVTTAGIELEPALGLNKEYVCFRDPDNVQLEFFMA
jgi:glyoxylase I family protein